MQQHYWLVFDRDGDIQVFIQAAHSLIDARMRAAIAGQEGRFKECHVLDAKTVKKVPKNCIGRTLTGVQAKKLLSRM